MPIIELTMEDYEHYEEVILQNSSLKTRVSQLEMHNQIMLDVLKEIMSWEENEETTWGAKARAAISLTFSGMDEPSEKDKAISQMVDALNYYATVGTKYAAIKLFNNPPDGESVHVYEHIAKTALEVAKQAGLIKY